MKIVSGTCFYNDCKSLERTLNSLKDKVDYMICVDGRFKHYCGGDSNNSVIGWSNDGSRELVQSYDNALLLTVANGYEIEKRQKYVDICTRNLYDFLLIVDSDEYVYEYDELAFRSRLNDIKTIQRYQSYNVFAIMLEVNSGKYQHIVHEFVSGAAPQTLERGGKKQFAHSPRLWYRPYEMEYNLRHYHFRNKNPASSLHYMETNPAIEIVPGMTLGHDHVLRDEQHLRGRKSYQRWLVTFEQQKLQRYQRENQQKDPKLEDYDNIDKMMG